MKTKLLFAIILVTVISCNRNVNNKNESKQNPIETEILNIRKQFNELNENLDNLEKIKSDPLNIAMEEKIYLQKIEGFEYLVPGLAYHEKYLNNNELKRLKVTFEQNMANLIHDYYVNNDSIYFAYYHQTIYYPMSNTLNVKKERNKYEHRFYFDDNKLIRWIDNKGEIKEQRDSLFINLENWILNNYEMSINAEKDF